LNRLSDFLKQTYHPIALNAARKKPKSRSAQPLRSAHQSPVLPTLPPPVLPEAGSPEQAKYLSAVCRILFGFQFMKIDSEKSKTLLIQRLKRIEGQIRGIQVMLNDERDCREIMQQLTAVHSAVQSSSRIFFQDYAAACLANMDDQDEKTSSAAREQMVNEMIALLDKTP